MHGHDHLFQRGVSGALADAVHGDFDLPGAVHDAGEAVSRGKAKIVVTVHRDNDRVVETRGIGDDAGDERSELFGSRIANRVGNVEGGRAGGNGGG